MIELLSQSPADYPESDASWEDIVAIAELRNLRFTHRDDHLRLAPMGVSLNDFGGGGFSLEVGNLSYKQRMHLALDMLASAEQYPHILGAPQKGVLPASGMFNETFGVAGAQKWSERSPQSKRRGKT